jgi:ATP-binding cassette, subfamily F, member 3
MIFLHGISKSHGKRVLFENVSLTITPGEKIGLIGPNGAGKTTLFHLITGDMELSSGSVQIERGTRIGYLAQESNFSSTRTVLEEVVEGDSTIAALKKEKDVLEHSHEAGTHRYGEVLHELEVLDFFNLEYKAKKVLSGLEFKERDFNRPIREMSGGWQMRVLLARLLTCHYDILLLDEPTNYLDLKAAIWFKDFLASYKGAFIMISHDRAFLDEVTNYTLILENGRMAMIKGNYEQYRKIQEEKRTHLQKQFNEQERQKKQLEEFIARFHGQPNKAGQVRGKRSQLERMEEIIVPEDRRESIRTFSFPQAQESGYRVIALKGVNKSYGDIKVYENFDFEIIKGEKAVLYGDNGAGKSTLLKILAGVIPFEAGVRKVGHNVSMGYFSQTRMDVLNEERTVLEEAFSAAKNMKTESVRTLLGIFLFSGDDVDKKIKILSGGEKSRLIMAKLLLEAPNFLLLDEPTTHLDVDAVDALIKALNSYSGTIVFISHDIHFVRSVANNVYEVNSGVVRKFPGTFDYYLEKTARDAGKVIELPKGSVSQPAKEANIPQNSDWHNARLSKKIKALRKKQEILKTDRYAKERVIANPRHGEDLINEYTQIVKNIDKEMAEIEAEITRLKTQFIQE